MNGTDVRTRAELDAPSPRPAAGRPLLSVSLDADNLWSYMKTHGDAGWEEYPTYLPLLAEKALARLAAHSLKITFFIVGQDAALARNRAALASIAAAGHDVGNHSFRHEPWLHEYSADELYEEIASAEQAIEAATGVRPRGFRGPGFSLTGDVLEVLGERDYVYDASTFPTFLGPIARLYYFRQTRNLPPEERRRRSQLFGTLRDGLRPIDPYVWTLRRGELLEIPVTTVPVVRVPMHLSYVMYLAEFGEGLARAYVRATTRWCRLWNVEPSLLLHSLDFLGCEDVAQLRFFPGMRTPSVRKLALFDWVVGHLRRHFELVSLDDHARILLERDRSRRLLRVAAPSPTPAAAVVT
jgi:peptidoglycan-N-acetylglucosamine deacetylase